MHVVGISYSVVVYDLVFNDQFHDIQMVILWTLVIFSGLLGFITLLRYKSVLDWEIIRGTRSKKENFFTSGYVYYYILEMVIIAAIPTPWYDGIVIIFFNDVQLKEAYYHLNDIMCLVAILRVLIVVRFFLVQTDWFCNRA
jgi:hypothetical protein